MMLLSCRLVSKSTMCLGPGIVQCAMCNTVRINLNLTYVGIHGEAYPDGMLPAYIPTWYSCSFEFTVLIDRGIWYFLPRYKPSLGRVREESEGVISAVFSVLSMSLMSN